MTKEELILYEMPFFVEFISINWLQDIIARYIGWKVNRKFNRFARRKNLIKY